MLALVRSRHCKELVVINREEFNTRIDDLKEYIGQRFDRLEGVDEDHELRIRAIETSPPGSSKMAKAGWVTGVGGLIYAIGQQIWTNVASKGDVK
jgi:hypothetical protein